MAKTKLPTVAASEAATVITAPVEDQAKDNLQKQIEELIAERNEANDIIQELKAQLTASIAEKVEKSDQLTVTVDEVAYVVNHGAHPYSAKEIAEDPEIAKEILKIEGQNAISKL